MLWSSITLWSLVLCYDFILFLHLSSFSLLFFSFLDFCTTFCELQHFNFCYTSKWKMHLSLLEFICCVMALSCGFAPPIIINRVFSFSFFLFSLSVFILFYFLLDISYFATSRETSNIIFIFLGIPHVKCLLQLSKHLYILHLPQTFLPALNNKRQYLSVANQFCS